MKNKILSFLILVVLLSLSGCNNNKLTQFKETTFDVGFNTPFTLIAFTDSQETFDKLFEEMKVEIRIMHKFYDIYNTYEGVNNIKTINDMAGMETVVVDAAIIDLLLESKKYSDITLEKFNPTLGPVLEIWHQAREEGIVLNQQNKPGISPSQAVLQQAYEFVGWDFVEINEKASTVYLTDARAALDVGAIAKGYAVEKVAQSLIDKGITNGVVNGGGNVKTIGSKLDNVPWVVGVTNPDRINDSSVLSLAFADSMSVVTSGDYERYFVDEDGNHQHHLIDSKTLQPARISRSITITTKNSTVADILSTAYSMTTLDEAKEFTQKLNIEDLGLVWIFDEKQENEDYKYMVVDGKYIYYNEVIEANIYKK